MTSLLLQILLYGSGITLQITAMVYALRPLTRALGRRKINELPKLDAEIERGSEPAPAITRHAMPQVAIIPDAPVSAVVRGSSAPTIRAGLIAKTEKLPSFVR